MCAFMMLLQCVKSVLSVVDVIKGIHGRPWGAFHILLKKEKEKENLYLPSAVFMAQVLVEPSKQLKQHNEQNIVKNPSWPEANQLAVYKRGRGFELGATEKQIQVVVRAGLEPGTA